MRSADEPAERAASRQVTRAASDERARSAERDAGEFDREIGVLRCIGSHARDVGLIFGTEGLVVAPLGWLAGVPLGFGLAHAMITATENVVHVHILFAGPPLDIAIALIRTLILALLAMQIPLRRAVSLKPGQALPSA